MLISVFTGILRKRAIKYIKENFNHIENKDIAICHGYYNNRCHWNSYTEFRMSPENTKVIATVCIKPNDRDVMVHFINYNMDGNYYYDVTLGTCNMIYEYQYIIGECDFSSDEIENMGERLLEFKYWIIDRSFRNKFVRKFYKWLEDKYCII